MMNIRLNGNDLNTAWLLDTLGKAKVTGQVKKAILNVSIPTLCDELQSRAEDIRYNSKILHGISLMYSLKIDYFLDDLSVLKSRIFRNFIYRNKKHGFERLQKSTQPSVIKMGAKFLTEDPLFNIFIDMIPKFEFELESNKRRRISIELADANNYADTQTNTFSFTQDLSRTHYDDLVDDFMDQNVDLSFKDMDLSQESIVKPDFEFNFEGGINMIGENNDASRSVDDMDIDLGDFDLNQPEIENLNNNETVTRDDNFFISASENQIVIPEPRGTKRLKTFRVVADTENKISRIQILEYGKNYEGLMSKPLNTNVNEQESLVYDEFNQVPPYTSYCQRVIFGKNSPQFKNTLDSRTITIGSDISMVNREIETIRRIQNMPPVLDYEIGRDGNQRNAILDENQDYFRSDEFDEIGQESGIEALNITFGDVVDSSQITSSQYRYENEFLSNDIPKILDNTQLTNYYIFLTGQNGQIMRNDDSKIVYNFNFPDEEISKISNYKRLTLTQLIPNRSINHRAISKKLAVKSFSSLLTLASKNYIAFETINRDNKYGFDELVDIIIVVPDNYITHMTS